MQQSRLIWESTLKKLRADRDKLVNTIRQDPELAGDKALAEKAAKLITTKLDEFNEELLKQLDKALNAQTPEGRDKENKVAGETIKRYLGKVKALADLDNNPFVPVKLHETLSASLNDLASKLL